ncbi:hypothetical protein LWI28_019935 [Acer negundo]|uniref:Uncharacterized protein n=1 Tax=Acer negundo TaxID=4023 RepID=A0AAD5JAG1_ACENE|nr:hypothetical protein LWI28_019935 [Acer negundo]
MAQPLTSPSLTPVRQLDYEVENALEVILETRTFSNDLSSENYTDPDPSLSTQWYPSREHRPLVWALPPGLLAAPDIEQGAMWIREFDLDVVCNMQACKAKEPDETSLKHATSQVALGIAPPQSDQIVAHTYEPDKNEQTFGPT